MPSSASLRQIAAHPEFRAGLREMSGLTLGIAAWGLVTGVAVVKSGLSVPVALIMTLTVFSGSAQLAALPLMVSDASLWVVWATAFCVNLRFVIFSAQWRPYFIRFPRSKRLLLGYFSADLTYVLFMKRFNDPEQPAGQIEYFVGANLANWTAWQVPAMIGILLADAIPTQWGLGFAGVLALMGLTYSLLSDRATAVAAVVAGTAAIAAFALPLKLNIVVAIAAAVAVGLFIDGSGDAGRRVRHWLSAATLRSSGTSGSGRHPARTPA